jgi:hypothetical protein
MIAVLGRRSLFAVLTALALALVAAMLIYSPAARAADKVAICHAVPIPAEKPTNHYNFLEVNETATGP